MNWLEIYFTMNWLEMALTMNWLEISFFNYELAKIRLASIWGPKKRTCKNGLIPGFESLDSNPDRLGPDPKLWYEQPWFIQQLVGGMV